MKECNNKNSTLEVRESNYELMRLISMFLIIIYHIILHGNLIARSDGVVNVLFVLVETLILMHVNSFIILTGYFQCTSIRKMKKVFSIIGQTWFYKVVIMLVLIKLGLIIIPTNQELVITLLPLDYGFNWYVNCYLVLYLISPILNKIINNSSKKELQQIVILLFIIISCVSTLTKDLVFNSFEGRSISTFILLYFIGAYLRLYPLDKESFLVKFKTRKKRLIYIYGFLVMVLLSYSFWGLGSYLERDRNILAVILNFFHLSYASPIIILQTIFYFLIFGTFKFKNKFVNIISKTTLGVYLIHENYYLRSILYYKLKLVYSPVTINKFGYVFVVAIIMYVVCIIIELIRQCLFKIICKINVFGKIDYILKIK